MSKTMFLFCLTSASITLNQEACLHFLKNETMLDKQNDCKKFDLLSQ